MNSQAPRTKLGKEFNGSPLPLLMILLPAAVLYLLSPGSLPRIIGMESGDFILTAALVIGGLSLPIGVITLVTLLIWHSKRRITLSPRAIWTPLLFACLDVALPLAILSLIMASVLRRIL